MTAFHTTHLADRSFDVVVAGAGMAGIAAALAAAEAGARVAVLDRSAEIGGSARLARGLIWAVADLERFRAIDPGADLRRLAMVASALPADLAWIRQHGLETGPRIEAVYGIGAGYRIQGDLATTFARLHQALTSLGVVCCVEHGVDDLRPIAGDGRWEVVGQTAIGQPFTLRTRAVVLAMGSYAADRHRWEQFLGTAARHVQLRASHFCTGTTLDLADRLDLAMSGAFTRFYGHLVPADVTPAPSDFGAVTLNLSEFGILVDAAGHRFTDESRGDWFNAEAVARHADGRAFLILDAQAIERARTTPRYAGAPTVDTLANLRQRGVPIATAPDLDQLAAQLGRIAGEPGIPPAAALHATVAAFNQAATVAGKPSLQQPPWTGLVVVPGITFGKGGVHVDDDLRALRKTGEPVDGLYVAGVDIGGLYETAYAGALAPALVTGRRAGLNAAAFARTVAIA